MGDFSLPHLLILGVTLFCGIIFPLRALIDAAKSSNPNKVLWIVVIFFFNFFGALLYWFVGRRAKTSS